MSLPSLPSPLPPILPSPTLRNKPRRTVKAKTGRPSNRAVAGRINWFNRLVSADRLAEAHAWHKRHGLHKYGIPSPAPLEPVTLGAAAPSALGGVGVNSQAGASNWDETTLTGVNLQSGCEPLLDAASPVELEADDTPLAAKAGDTRTFTPPAGESEGKRGFCQEGSIRKDNNVGEMVSVWPKLAEAVVGKMCRNKQYNELRVEGEGGKEMWTKVGNWLWVGGLVRGERVLVRKVWGSADDTDAEYEILKRLDVNDAPKPLEAAPVDPAPVVEAVAVVEEAGPDKSQVLPQFQKEEPDFPRKQESGDDYIARIRAEAALWANGMGR